MRPGPGLAATGRPRMRLAFRRGRGALLVSAVLGAGVGCSHEIASPDPALSSITPDLVCNGASARGPGGASTVPLAGTDFTPMPVKTLEGPPRLQLPAVMLSPVHALPGGTLAPGAVTITDDPTQPAASRVHWASEQQMSFDV